MNKKNGANIGAVIEIGASDVSMRISQLSKGGLSTVDHLEYPTRIGHDVFDSGTVSFDCLRELSGALDKFSAALQTYRVQKVKVISCSALRGAKNRTLVADQLKVRNGVDVTVLEESQEKAYLYSEVTAMLNKGSFLRPGNSVIAYVGSGSIGVAASDGEKVFAFQNVSTGAMKLLDILQGMRGAYEDFHGVVEDYLNTVLNRIAAFDFPIENLILTGSQIEFIAKLCEGRQMDGVSQFDTKRLTEVYRSMRDMTPESIALRYGIGEEQGAILYISLAIYNAMLRFCPKAEVACCPMADISSAMARTMLVPKAEAERGAYCRKSALACAETTAARFGCDAAHSQHIRETCGLIFDKLKRVHGLDPSKRLILELASILHSCGSFVSVRQHNICTFDLIKGMDLFGLSEAEVLETAFVAGSISNNLAVDENPDFARLSIEEKLIVSKLAAMFRMANALDKSHQNKLRDLKVSVEEGRVLFRAGTSADALLEQWAFAESAQFFKDVFGLSPELTVKFELL